MDPKIVQVWQGKFTALMARVASLKQSGEDPIALARDVEAFTHQHPPVLPEDPAAEQFDDMDDLARKTHDALVTADINQRMAAIAARTADFVVLTARVGAQAATNTTAAKSISFEQLTATVSAATDAVAALKDLQATVKAQTGAPGQIEALAAKLDQAVAALQAFKTAAGTID